MITVKIYNEHGALNSGPILDAVQSGLTRSGYSVVSHGEDVPVIWSVLWSGRMLPNRHIYKMARAAGKPVMIIEVGNLLRGQTWRISLDNINRSGDFGQGALDPRRPAELGVGLRSPQMVRRPEILIAGQHERSLQWESQPSMTDWISQTVELVRSHTDRDILVRPHPRSRITPCSFGRNVKLITPRRLLSTYDDFDIDYSYHAVINHNSGPAVQAAIAGIPVICDETSLAYPVSERLANIEHATLPDRPQWFLELCHTEWTVTEIAQGEPFARIKISIDQRRNR